MWGVCPGKDVEMSVSEAMTKRRRRSFSPEFKAEIVALCQRPGNTVAGVSKEYELAETAVRRWVRQAEVDAGAKPGTSSGEGEEMARLRK
jgi:transposase